MKPYSATTLERLSDNVVSLFSPKVAHKRAIDRARHKMFSYDAARFSDVRGSAGINSRASESPSNIRDRTRLIWEARDLCDNDSICKSILLKVSSYVCSKIQYIPNTGDLAIDEKYREYWNQFSQVSDITGRHTFQELMQLAVMSMYRDGDVGFIIVNNPDDPFIKLQAIEADRIGDPYDYSYAEDYISGISIDKVGKPTAYNIYYRSRLGTYGKPVEISAESFIHLYDPTRLDQYRGVSAYATVIETARDKKEIFAFEKIAVKWGSSKAGVVKKNNSEADATDYYSSRDPSTPQAKLERIEAGTVTYLETNEDMAIFGNDRPSATFNGFMEAMIREIAMGFNLPYGFVYDLSALSGPASRMEATQAKRAIERIQCILEYKALNKIKNLVFAKGIAQGLLPQAPNWQKGKFMYPAWPTIDVGRESAANLAENKQGLKSANDILGEQGEYWRDTQEQIAMEASNIVDLSRKYNIPINMIQMLTPNGNEALVNQNGDTPPLITTIGIGGTQALVEVLQSVAIGSIDRESGIATLMTVFGVTEEQADAMIPQEGSVDPNAIKQAQELLPKPIK